MKPRIVFMFSGQGSQYPGMGQELYTLNPVFRRCIDEFSEVALPLLGVDLASEIFSDHQVESDALLRTRYTNPALFMFNYAVATTLESLGVVPDELLGYSLGELSAAAYSGLVDRFELFVRLIRASLALEAHSPNGGMLAVLDSHQLWDRHPDWFDNTALASVNCKQSFVVSGLTEVLDALQQQLRSQGILIQRLPVMQAFHSPWIDAAQSAVSREIDTLPLRDRGRFPIYSCAAPLEGGKPVQGQIRKFWDALRQPILFEPALQRIETDEPRLYLDVGPSGTLATFTKLSLGTGSKSKALPIVDQFGMNEKSLEKALTVAMTWRIS